jgi:hypothetical protein
MKRLEPERVKKLVKLVFYALQLRSIQIQMVARIPVLEYKTVIKYLLYQKDEEQNGFKGLGIDKDTSTETIRKHKFIETCVFIMGLFIALRGLVRMRTKENKGQQKNNLQGLDYFFSFSSPNLFLITSSMIIMNAM